MIKLEPNLEICGEINVKLLYMPTVSFEQCTISQNTKYVFSFNFIEIMKT